MATKGRRARQEYQITEQGAAILALLRQNVAELHRELQEVPEPATKRR